LTDDSFSDLYAERAAILLRFGDQKPSNAAQWVEIIVNAQLQDGSWGLYSENLTFDSESTTGEPEGGGPRQETDSCGGFNSLWFVHPA